MAEVFKDSSQWAYLKIYQSGALTDAATDASPLGYKVTVQVTAGSSAAEARTVVRESAGIYKTLLLLADTDLERTIYVDWKFTMPQSSYESSRRDQYEVITPYFSIKEAEELYAGTLGWNWSTKKDQNGNDLSAAQILQAETYARMAEQYARYLINAYCNQTFGLRQKTVTSYGQQSDVIVFNERLISINKMWENGHLLLDNTSDPVYNELLYPVEITETKYGIRENGSDDMMGRDIDEYEVINPVYINGVFAQGYRYDVDAIVGYYNVPSEVQLAARALVVDFFCKDNAWQQKYINSISASDWRIVFDRIKYKGTGNFFADQVLAPIIWQPMVII
jgi:hypothetical protein